MPEFTPFEPVTNFLRGRQAAQQNALGRAELERAQNVNALMKNPQATPEQYARAGETGIANALMGQQEFTAEQKKQIATKIYQAAQYALQQPEGQSKAFIERNYPELAQLAGPAWATADDNAVRAKMQEALGIYGPAAGIGPAVQKDEEFTLSPGQKRFKNGREVAAVDPLPRGNGISMTMPDGTEVQIGGDGVPNYGGVGLTKPNQTKLQEAFINAQGNAYALREQIAKYRPEFSTLGGKFKAGVAGAKDMIGMENAPQQQQFLSDFTSWKADTASLLSAYLNQLSGAAISPHEEVRLKAGFPNADDGPTEYQAKATATMRRFALAQARAAYLLSNPAQSMDSVSLDKMSNIIALEANRLAKSLESGGMDAEQAKQQAILKTRARYGLDNGQ